MELDECALLAHFSAQAQSLSTLIARSLNVARYSPSVRPPCIRLTMPPEKLTERLITVFDVETTGLDTQTSRVVQFGHADFRNGALLRLHDATINPCTSIPTAASEIHKIYDSDVVDAPTFGMASKGIAEILGGTDERAAPILCAYNGTRYDVPLLNAEFERHCVSIRIDAARVLDPLVWLKFHRRHWSSRSLAAASEHFRYPLSDAHRASADAEATGTILCRMIEQGMVPDDVNEAFATQRDMVAVLEHEDQLYGRFLYIDRHDNTTLRMGFGKHVGAAIMNVPRSYLRWVLTLSDLPSFAVSELRSFL